MTFRKKRREKAPILVSMRLGFSTLPSISLLMAIFCAAASLPAQAQDSAADSTPAATLRMQAIAYENGEGVARDPVLAASLYCKGARLGDAEAQYNLGWMYANGRGVARNDVTAAFFFHAAAEQGLAAAQRMLKVVGGPTTEVPDCMREPARPAASGPIDGPGVDYQAVAPRKIFELVMKMAPQYQVQPQLALAIIAAESNFDSQAQSPMNAQGLMQLIPETSQRFQVRNPFDAAQNIRGGLAYLRWLLAYFKGDVTLVAAAYNAGEKAVDRHAGIPPYAETQGYVKRIRETFKRDEHPYDPAVAKPSPDLEKIASRRLM